MSLKGGKFRGYKESEERELIKTYVTGFAFELKEESNDLLPAETVLVDLLNRMDFDKRDYVKITEDYFEILGRGCKDNRLVFRKEGRFNLLYFKPSAPQ